MQKECDHAWVQRVSDSPTMFYQECRKCNKVMDKLDKLLKAKKEIEEEISSLYAEESIDLEVETEEYIDSLSGRIKVAAEIFYGETGCTLSTLKDHIGCIKLKKGRYFLFSHECLELDILTNKNLLIFVRDILNCDADLSNFMIYDLENHGHHVSLTSLLDIKIKK